MAQSYEISGISRTTGKRATITVAHDRKEALRVARKAKERGVKNVRIEISKPEPIGEELSRNARRKQAESKARRKGKMK